MEIILASGSPRRKEILEQIGIAFQIRPAKGEEVIRGDDPVEVVKELSAAKAGEVASDAEGDCLVIGADTIVVYEGRILGKPKDEQDAINMLKMLSGQKHQVYTGVTAIIKGKVNKTITFAECTEVKIFPMEEEEIVSYVKTGEPMDKAGSYAVQGYFAKYIEGIIGDYYNVMGLPIARLCRILKGEGYGRI